MSQLVINLLVKDGNLDNVNENISICESLGVDYCVFDYREDKSFEIDGIHFLPQEWGSYRSHIVDFLTESQYKSFVNLQEPTLLMPDFTDNFNPSIFEDQNIGSVYGDFILVTDNGEVPIFNTSMPSAHNSFPFIAMSSRAYCSKALTAENPESAVLSGLVSIHIPEFLCKLSNG